jgi:hypothetical protein
VCSFSKEGEQKDVTLRRFAFANGEVCEQQSLASSMHYERADLLSGVKRDIGARIRGEDRQIG